MERTRVGLIGVGQIGKRHVERYSTMDSVEMVAIADIDEAEARRVSTQYAIPNVYTDFHELLKRADIEAVDVCLHNNYHMPMTLAALQAGKHVYCEKPMAGAYVDAEAMYNAARDAGLMLSIQLSTLYAKDTRAAMALIEGGHLGRIYHGRSTGFRRRGRPFVDGYGSPSFVNKAVSAGGALYDMGVYHIARMLYMLGNPAVERISGTIYQETDMDATRQASSGYNVEELGLGFVRLQGGITLDIIEAWAIHLDGMQGSTILGSQGGVRLDPFGFFQCIGHLDMDCTADLDRFMYRVHNVQGEGDEYESPQHHWVAALQGRVELMPTAELALKTMLISEGIYLSHELGREVSAGEVREHSVSSAAEV